jgi:hypothetical protein
MTAGEGYAHTVVRQAFTALVWQAESDAGSCCCRCGFFKADPS